LHRAIEDVSDIDGCVPELPLDEFYRMCEHQQFTSNKKLVDFGNGSGLRFVTVYAIQDLSPVGNNNLEYVFQGLTNDGKYYVKIIAEMMHSSLDGTGEIPPDVMTGSAEDVQEYFGIFGEIFSQNESGFTPELDWLDEVIGALSFE